MLIATWIVTFVIIVGIGVWSGTKIKSANQWSGGDKTMGPLTLGCVFAAWQIGGMAVVGAAQNGYTLGISGAWYSIAGSFYFIALALFAKLIRNNMPGDSVPSICKSASTPRPAACTPTPGSSTASCTSPISSRPWLPSSRSPSPV